MSGGARTYQLDVVWKDQVKSIIDTIITDLGRLDVLINNAGVNPAETYRRRRISFRRDAAKPTVSVPRYAIPRQLVVLSASDLKKL